MRRPGYLTLIAVLCYSSGTFADSWYDAVSNARNERTLLETSAMETVWGRPLSGGAIRALFIAPKPALGDAVALAKRLELDPALVGMGVPDGPLDDALSEELARALRRDYDVIVLGNVDLGRWPEETVANLSEQVRDGAGLVYAYLPAASAGFMAARTSVAVPGFVQRGTGAALTPEWSDGLGFLRTFALGAGRVVELAYPGEPAYRHFLIPPLKDVVRAEPAYFDTYLSLVARAVRWAANREPERRIVDVLDTGIGQPSDDEIPPNLPPEHVQHMRDSVRHTPTRAFLVRLDAPVDGRHTLTYQLRDPLRSVTISTPEGIDVPGGDDSAVVQVPVGRGVFFLDVWLQRKDEMVDWFTTTVENRTWPELRDLRVSKGRVLKSDSVVLSFNVRQSYHNARPVTAYGRAIDRYGRVVAEAYQRVPPDGAQVTLRLDWVDVITRQLRIEGYVADVPAPPLGAWQLQQAAYDYAFVVVDDVASPAPVFAADFEQVDNYGAFDGLQAMAALSVDGVVADNGESSQFVAQRHNLQLIPEDSGNPDEVYRALTERAVRWSIWNAVLDRQSPIRLGPAIEGSRPLLLPDGSPSERGGVVGETIQSLWDTPAPLIYYGQDLAALDYEVRSGDEEPIRAERYAVDKGEAAVFLRRPDARRERAKIVWDFPDDRFVYDIFEGKRRKNKAEFKLDPGEAKVFSVLPYEVTEVEVTVPPEIQRGRRLMIEVGLRTRVRMAGCHPIRLTIYDAEENRVTHYTQSFVAEYGGGRTYVPLALNEPTGDYTVRARDVLTGMEATAEYRVLPPNSTTVRPLR